jgi:V8-like Glu-specific endopeptidase
MYLKGLLLKKNFKLLASCMALLSLTLTALAKNEKSIIGLDERQQITDISVDPFYSSIGYIYNSEMDVFCTGTLITHKHVLTNGHCVMKSKVYPSELVSPSSLSFTPGKVHLSSAPFKVFTGKKIKTLAVWANTGNPDYDLAVIELDRSTKLPNISLMTFSDPQRLKRRLVYVTGYSAQKELATLWEGVGRVEAILSGNLSFTHSADTFGGTSGSVVRMMENKRWEAIGLHRGNYLGGRTEMNRGVLFNSQIIDVIKRWIKN